jgi:hypothetical protein
VATPQPPDLPTVGRFAFSARRSIIRTVWGKPRRRLADLERATVVLHLTNGRSLAGVVIAEYDDVVSLTNVRVEVDDGGFQPADGEVLVAWEKIVWTQLGVTIDDSVGVVGEVRSLPARDLQGTTVRQAG